MWGRLMRGFAEGVEQYIGEDATGAAVRGTGRGVTVAARNIFAGRMSRCAVPNTTSTIYEMRLGEMRLGEMRLHEISAVKCTSFVHKGEGLCHSSHDNPELSLRQPGPSART